MKPIKFILLIFISLIMSCSSSEDDPQVTSPTPTPTPKATTLKEAANFPIGNIVSASRLSNDNNFKILLNKEFNSITAENDMKMASMFTGPNTYDFSKGDAIVAYAKANGFRVHGHALVWHASIPNWLKNYAGTDADFEAQVRDYIKATVAHFVTFKNSEGKSIVESWDVVNEHFTSDAAAAVFNTRIGSDYVSKCFIWAREADPNVKLFYNDYSLGSQGSKASQVVSMVNAFKTTATPIDGIGMQMHIDYQNPTLATLTDNLYMLKATGLLIHFSEVDMTVNKNKALTSLTTERSNAQKDRYKDIAILYKTIPAAQQYGITFWGMRDNDSWLLSFNNNQNEWPLLFDSNYKYKPAFTGFLEGLNK